MYQNLPFFNEFVVTCPRRRIEVNNYLYDRFGIIGGYDLGGLDKRMENQMLICLTELNTAAQIEGCWMDLKRRHNERTVIYELSVPGRCACHLPALDVPAADLPPSALLREELALPEVSESDLVRHYVRLSQLNYAIDIGFYPLGSCTMKYNPKVHEDAARITGFAEAHPNLPADLAQGAYQLMYALQQYLAALTGFDAVSLQPAAGAQGELAGVLIIRAYHLARGDNSRTKILIPDTAHGTNPASTAMAGFQVVQVNSDARGNIDLDDLQSKLDETIAGMMLTNPNTLGLFDEHILEVTRLVHDAGGIDVRRRREL